jgi:hypothetical protein
MRHLNSVAVSIATASASSSSSLSSSSSPPLECATVFAAQADAHARCGDFDRSVLALEECWALCEAQPHWGMDTILGGGIICKEISYRFFIQ